jgi:hypothetical protein
MTVSHKVTEEARAENIPLENVSPDNIAISEDEEKSADTLERVTTDKFGAVEVDEDETGGLHCSRCPPSPVIFAITRLE